MAETHLLKLCISVGRKFQFLKLFSKFEQRTLISLYYNYCNLIIVIFFIRLLETERVLQKFNIFCRSLVFISNKKEENKTHYQVFNTHNQPFLQNIHLHLV